MGWGANSEYRHGAYGRKGDQGEMVVESYLKRNNISFEKKNDYHSQVVQKIDFIVDNKLIDVKTNAFKDYLAVELETDKGYRGWLYTSEAEEIYGVDLDKREIYVYSTSDMREYVKQNRNRAKYTKKGALLLWVHKDEDFIKRLT